MLVRCGVLFGSNAFKNQGGNADFRPLYLYKGRFFYTLFDPGSGRSLFYKDEVKL